MIREDILAKVKEKEYIQRCLAVKVCPVCGDDLSVSRSVTGNIIKYKCFNDQCSYIYPDPIY